MTEVSSSSTSSLLRSGAEVARAIAQSDSPEDLVASLSAQSLLCAIHAVGEEGAGDLIELLAPQQYLEVFDFEVWEKDQFQEERFWWWLAQVERSDSFEPILQFFRATDLRLLSMIAQRHLEVAVFEDATEKPPWEKCYTPDKGHTWLRIYDLKEDQERLFGKLLAVLFETQADVFYQFTGTFRAATFAEMEEELYQEKLKRSLDIGIPSFEDAVRIHTPLSDEQFKNEVLKNKVLSEELIQAFSALRSDAIEIAVLEERLEPLISFVREIYQRSSDEQEDDEAFQREMALLANAAAVYAGVGFGDLGEMGRIVSFVRSTLNLGLKRAMTLMGSEDLEELYAIFKALGLQPFYRLGVAQHSDLSALRASG